MARGPLVRRCRVSCLSWAVYSQAFRTPDTTGPPWSPQTLPTGNSQRIQMSLEKPIHMSFQKVHLSTRESSCFPGGPEDTDGAGKQWIPKHSWPVPLRLFKLQTFRRLCHILCPVLPCALEAQARCANSAAVPRAEQSTTCFSWKSLVIC